MAVVVLVVAIVAAGCSSEDEPTASPAFCRAADDFNAELERARAEGEASVERQLPLVEEMARLAPKAIDDDADTYADAMRRRADGDRSVVDNPEIETAVNNVNRFANQACNVYERNSGL
jgi:hypothetical protein